MKIKPYFLRKIKEKIKCRLLQVLFGALRINNARMYQFMERNKWYKYTELSTDYTDHSNSWKARNFKLSNCAEHYLV